MNLKRVLLTILVMMPVIVLTASGQTMDFKDAGQRGVQIGYNKFTDQSVILTKRDFVAGRFAKGNFIDPNANGGILEISAAVFFKGPRPAEFSEKATVIFAIFPDATTASGKLAQHGSDKRLYIAPDSKLLALADGERFELGRAEKTFGFDSLGRYDGAAYIAIPLADFKKIVQAKKLEIAIGSIELKLEKRHVERLRNLVIVIEGSQP